MYKRQLPILERDITKLTISLVKEHCFLAQEHAGVVIYGPITLMDRKLSILVRVLIVLGNCVFMTLQAKREHFLGVDIFALTINLGK